MKKKYIVASDVGGTCTDTVVFAAGEAVHLGKALSTPPDFAAGVLDSIGVAAKGMGMDRGDLLSQTKLFVHGSTVVDNTILTREGAQVGLLTTAGFEDTILVTRGAYGRWGGLTEDRIKHPVKTDRAPALVDPQRIVGVTERVDYKGKILKEIDEAEVEQAVRLLIEERGAEAIAVSFLWSFYNPENEQRVRSIIKRIAPHAYCTLSSEIAPAPGEYERTSTTVINAYAGEIAKSYLASLEGLLESAGYDGPVMVMQGYGGLIPAKEAAERSIGMLESGPAAGVVGSKALGDLLNQKNIIATDMGGTTFKVSVIQDQMIEYAREPMVDRFHYNQPKIEVISIGAGGGSIISLEEGSNVPRVGPRSAGSRPGPVCYGLGGDEPTLTDVFLLIGYMDPSIFLGGTMKLDVDRTSEVFKQKIADPLGLSIERAAIGIYRIASAQITDLIRQITVERGLDPRDFVLHSFGGSCGILAGMFAAELNVRQMVVPYTASVNCAFGLISSDIVHEYSKPWTLPIPQPISAINDIFAPMVEQARKQLSDEGFAGDKISMECAVDLRYSRQVHELVTPLQGQFPYEQQGLDSLVRDFEALYERKYGKGSAYREAGIEMTQFRLTARGLMERSEMIAEEIIGENSTSARIGRRPIFVDAQDGMIEADIYDFEKLHPGNVIKGAAVVHTPITTIVLQQGQIGTVDGYRNIIVDFG